MGRRNCDGGNLNPLIGAPLTGDEGATSPDREIRLPVKEFSRLSKKPYLSQPFEVIT